MPSKSNAKQKAQQEALAIYTGLNLNAINAIRQGRTSPPSQDTVLAYALFRVDDHKESKDLLKTCGIIDEGGVQVPQNLDLDRALNKKQNDYKMFDESRYTTIMRKVDSIQTTTPTKQNLNPSEKLLTMVMDKPQALLKGLNVQITPSAKGVKNNKYLHTLSQLKNHPLFSLPKAQKLVDGSIAIVKTSLAKKSAKSAQKATVVTADEESINNIALAILNTDSKSFQTLTGLEMSSESKGKDYFDALDKKYGKSNSKLLGQIKQRFGELRVAVHKHAKEMVNKSINITEIKSDSMGKTTISCTTSNGETFNIEVTNQRLATYYDQAVKAKAKEEKKLADSTAPTPRQKAQEIVDRVWPKTSQSGNMTPQPRTADTGQLETFFNHVNQDPDVAKAILGIISDKLITPITKIPGPYGNEVSLTKGLKQIVNQASPTSETTPTKKNVSGAGKHMDDDAEVMFEPTIKLSEDIEQIHGYDFNDYLSLEYGEHNGPGTKEESILLALVLGRKARYHVIPEDEDEPDYWVLDSLDTVITEYLEKSDKVEGKKGSRSEYQWNKAAKIGFMDSLNITELFVEHPENCFKLKGGAQTLEDNLDKIKATLLTFLPKPARAEAYVELLKEASIPTDMNDAITHLISLEDKESQEASGKGTKIPSSREVLSEQFQINFPDGYDRTKIHMYECILMHGGYNELAKLEELVNADTSLTGGTFKNPLLTAIQTLKNTQKNEEFYSILPQILVGQDFRTLLSFACEFELTKKLNEGEMKSKYDYLKQVSKSDEANVELFEMANKHYDMNMPELKNIDAIIQHLVSIHTEDPDAQEGLTECLKQIHARVMTNDEVQVREEDHVKNPVVVDKASIDATKAEIINQFYEGHLKRHEAGRNFGANLKSIQGDIRDSGLTSQQFPPEEIQSKLIQTIQQNRGNREFNHELMGIFRRKHQQPTIPCSDETKQMLKECIESQRSSFTPS